MWEILNQPLLPEAVSAWEGTVGWWVAGIALALLVLELARYAWQQRMSWTLAGDTVTNFITYGAFVVVTYGALAGLYVTAYYTAWEFAPWKIEVTPLTVLICLLLADLAYYWEHRFTHRVNVAWATHSVHHSSPNYNISVAFRFGPMDGVWPIFFHLPLVLMGFHPLLVFAVEAFIQVYQTLLHTEVVRKLPRPVEAVFNTPSHHRVHHGANRRYIDRNYGGMFIVWDRLFGTFAAEREAVRYGITRPLNSVNPLKVWFHGFVRLGREALGARDPGAFWRILFGPPGGDKAAPATTSSRTSPLDTPVPGESA